MHFRFVVDEKHPTFSEDGETPDRIDEWWSQIAKTRKYPALSKMALALCTIFHGPQVCHIIDLL